MLNIPVASTVKKQNKSHLKEVFVLLDFFAGVKRRAKIINMKPIILNIVTGSSYAIIEKIIEITIEKLTIVEERDIGPKVNALEYRD